jgi:hypothetical protein
MRADDSARLAFIFAAIFLYMGNVERPKCGHVFARHFRGHKYKEGA